MVTKEDLRSLQKTPLRYKEVLSADRIREVARNFGENFYVSFSGGKDSEVLVDLTARTLHELGYSDFKVLYVNTGLEYSSVRNFIQPFLDKVSERHHIDINLDVRTPQLSFKKTIEKYGYPIISKEVALCIEEARLGLSKRDGSYERSIQKMNGTLTDGNGNKSRYNCDKYRFLLDAPFKISKHCCSITKMQPVLDYERETGAIPIIATMASESALRESAWIKRGGCNVFDSKRPRSCPLSFWLENDILSYIKKYDLGIAEPYGEIILKPDPSRGFLKGQTRFPGFDTLDFDRDAFALTGQKRTGCCFCLFGITSDSERFLRMQRLEPKKADFILRGGRFDENGMWGPSEDGLGMWFVCDFLSSCGIPVPYLGDYGQDWAIDFAA